MTSEKGYPVSMFMFIQQKCTLRNSQRCAVWENATALYTWKAFPPIELAPNLQYVQLHSAGANQILGLPLFEKTDIVFSTSNGVHPPEISEWVFASFLGFQHHCQQNFPIFT
jgi:phosphoglycerate dehydrogenase-like enzyme